MFDVEVFFSIVPCADAQRLCSCHTNSPGGRGEFKPSYVTAVSIVLGMDVFRLVFIQRHLILTDESGTFAVGVVFPGTAAIVTDLIIGSRKSHSHAKFRYKRDGCGCGAIVGVNKNRTVFIDGVGEGHVGTDRQ